MHEGWNYEPLVYHDLTREQAADEKHGGLLTLGACGSGRTHLLGQIAAKGNRVLIAAYTNKAVENLNKRGIKARTLDNIFPTNEPMHKWLSKHAAVTDIFIDEFSMLHPKWLDILHRMKICKPELKISFFGDIRQADG